MKRAERRTDVRYTFKNKAFIELSPQASDQNAIFLNYLKNIFSFNQKIPFNILYFAADSHLPKKNMKNEIIDIGNEGISFVCSLKNITDLSLTFCFRSLHTPHNITSTKGKVVWKIQNGNNLFKVGVSIRPNHKWCELISGLKKKYIILQTDFSKREKGSVNKKLPLTEILSWLSSEDWHIRYKAVANIKKSECINNKIHILASTAKDPDYRVRIATIYALSELQVTSSINIIGDLLLNDTNWLVRESAATFIGKCNKEYALKFLLASLKDKDIYVKLSVINALGNLKAKASIPFLKSLLKTKEIRVHKLVSESLQKINNCSLSLDK